jgi:hypothetical protein
VNGLYAFAMTQLSIPKGKPKIIFDSMAESNKADTITYSQKMDK